eukprot:15456179-Alexandrium_andersonii.AAC.1
MNIAHGSRSRIVFCGPRCDAALRVADQLWPAVAVAAGSGPAAVWSQRLPRGRHRCFGDVVAGFVIVGAVGFASVQ